MGIPGAGHHMSKRELIRIICGGVISLGLIVALGYFG